MRILFHLVPKPIRTNIPLPDRVNWGHIIGVALIAGIGFTMSLFITNLAFTEQFMIDQVKYGILGASLVAGVLGFLVLKKASKE